jgi:hypothetical protein
MQTRTAAAAALRADGRAGVVTQAARCEADTTFVCVLFCLLSDALRLHPAPMEKGNLFKAKYAPFRGDSSKESYSLDEIIYKSKDGASCLHYVPSRASGR